MANRCDLILLNSAQGGIDSVITLEKHANRFSKNDQVIFLGTAGITGDDFVAGEIFQASFFRWTSIGLVLKKGFLPSFLLQDIKAHKFSPGVRSLPVISAPEITADDRIALLLHKQSGRCLENLETYGIARWLKSNDFSLSAFLSVTNRVGKQSHRQYLRHRKLAWLGLAETICDIIKQTKYKD